MPSTRDHETIPCRMPSELYDAVKQRAAQEDRSIASLIRTAIRNYLENAK